MKKFGLLILGLSVLFFAGNFTQAKDYEYTNLDITADVLIDGTMNVKEDFTANFFVDKHGIIRDIPLNYSVDGKKFHINITNINVKYNTFNTTRKNGKYEIKIGDSDKTLKGEKTYQIFYTTYGLIRNFSGMGYAELYWNLVGYDFDTNIKEIHSVINLPKSYTGFTKGNFLITTDGKTINVEDFQGTIDWSQGDKIIISYDKGLPAFQGITLAVKFPNNYFEFDHKKQVKLLGYATLNYLSEHLGIIVVSIFIIIIILIKIKSLEKEKRINIKSEALPRKYAKKFPVIVQYEPPKGINSAEAGLLLHREAMPKDMLSLIYKWAAEGLISLSIDEEEDGWLFKRNKKVLVIIKNKDIDGDIQTYDKNLVIVHNSNTTEYTDSVVPTYEKNFFNALFHKGDARITKNTNLYYKMELANLHSYGINKGWFYVKKTIVPILGWIIAILFIGSIIAFKCGYDSIGLKLIFPCFFLGLLVCLIPEDRTKETEEGAKLISHVLGYKKFLKACDEDKLRLFLKQDPLYFDKILPYAVAFGLETKLIKKIEPILKEMNIRSTLYDGDINYINTINYTVSSTASHSYDKSNSYSSSSGFSGGSSFGGGFSSGGGGGGGGGRSW